MIISLFMEETPVCGEDRGAAQAAAGPGCRDNGPQTREQREQHGIDQRVLRREL
jgi:hypothetical protein